MANLKHVFSRRNFLTTTSKWASLLAGLIPAVPALAQTTPFPPIPLPAFKGKFITRDNPLYPTWYWAMTWYRYKAPRYPAFFAQPQDEDDLKLLLNFAAENNLKIALRSSGHNISMPSLRSNAITIDMTLFNQLEIDEAQKTAWAGPGLTSEELNRALYAKGFSFPSAHTGFVTIGGYLLGGGMGWNMPAWGMGCGSVVAAELLLADGRKVIASPTENPDLYWAMRGVGPGFFAIVLRYQLRIYETPKPVKNVFYIPLEKLEEACAELLRLLPASNNRTEVLGALGKFSPPGTPPVDQRWFWVITLFSFGATTEEAIIAADVFNNSKLPELCWLQAYHNQPLTYLDLYQQLGTDAFSEYRTTELAIFTEDPAKVLRILADELEPNQIDPRSFGFSVLGTNPTVPEPCVYSYKAPHYISWYLMGTKPEHTAANAALIRQIYDKVKPYCTGYYMNEVDLALFPEIAEASFTPEKWQRLNRVRQDYDPNQRFASYVTSPGAEG